MISRTCAAILFVLSLFLMLLPRDKYEQRTIIEYIILITSIVLIIAVFFEPA